MKKTKRFAAGTLALLMALGVSACGNGSSSESSYVQKVEVDTEAVKDSIEPIPDGADKEITWMSYFDINPGKAVKEKRTDLTLFESLGGKINYSRTTSLNKFEKLATAVMSDQVPDIFWYEQGMTFPYSVIAGMFQPIDEIVDFEKPLWSGVKSTADQFVLNGKHYVAYTVRDSYF